MADEVATVSSSPAFAAVVISNQSYSGGAFDGPGDGLVDQSDGRADEQPLAEPTGRVCQRHLLADAHRAVVDAREVRGEKEAHDHPEFHALGDAAAFVSFRIDVAREQQPDEDAGEHE